MMNRFVVKGITLLWLASIAVYGGNGKEAAPAEAVVEPIPPMHTPTPVYVGLGLLWGKYSGLCNNVPGCHYEDVTHGALLRAGYEWNQYIGIEARLLGTFWGDDPLGGQKLRHIGLYAKPMYPFHEDFNLYGLLGYGWTKTTTNNNNLNTIDDSGFSAGIGLEYDLSDKMDDKEADTAYDRGFDGQADQERGWGLFVDYQRLLIKSNVPDMDVVSAGVTYDF
jgi:OOP family OmpA-OmpF porin